MVGKWTTRVNRVTKDVQTSGSSSNVEIFLGKVAETSAVCYSSKYTSLHLI